MLKERLQWIYNKRYDVDLKKGFYILRPLKMVKKICLSACLLERQDYKRLSIFLYRLQIRFENLCELSQMNFFHKYWFYL